MSETQAWWVPASASSSGTGGQARTGCQEPGGGSPVCGAGPGRPGMFQPSDAVPASRHRGRPGDETAQSFRNQGDSPLVIVAGPAGDSFTATSPGGGGAPGHTLPRGIGLVREQPIGWDGPTRPGLHHTVRGQHTSSLSAWALMGPPTRVSVQKRCCYPLSCVPSEFLCHSPSPRTAD